MNDVLVPDLEERLSNRRVTLLLADSPTELEQIHGLLERLGFHFSSNWKEVIDHLVIGRSLVVTLGSMSTPEIFDIVTQFVRRGGTIQITDRETLDFRTYSYDTDSVKLVITGMTTEWARYPESSQIARYVQGLADLEKI